jgi:hypothetical protein
MANIGRCLPVLRAPDVRYGTVEFEEAVRMKTILQKKTFSVVIQLETHGKGQPSLTAHMILNHFDLDDDGNICLSSLTDVQGTLNVIDSLKTELDCLAYEIASRRAQTAVRRAHFSVISNDDSDLTATEQGGQGLNS